MNKSHLQWKRGDLFSYVTTSTAVFIHGQKPGESNTRHNLGRVASITRDGNISAYADAFGTIHKSIPAGALLRVGQDRFSCADCWGAYIGLSWNDRYEMRTLDALRKFISNYRLAA
ncbi:MAG: hypothetical protein KDK34_12400 [Leptospiraceae bacterium]|nr:hypothetical protein [Leptospiraceae bacterium]